MERRGEFAVCIHNWIYYFFYFPYFLVVVDVLGFNILGFEICSECQEILR
jgi:hypothetical protein